MESHTPIKPWMWVVVIVAILFTLFNFDPIGNQLEKSFGAGAGRWTINILLAVLLVYVFVKKK